MEKGFSKSNLTWNDSEHLSSSGNIRNTEKLSYDRQHQYEILVTAYDCGQKPAAQDTLVQVDVKPVCKPGWQGELPVSVLCENRAWFGVHSLLGMSANHHNA